MDDQQRLDSWKEIARYAKKSTKTCRRWAKQLGLPVHRIEKTSSHSKVIAFRDEIDKWFRSR